MKISNNLDFCTYLLTEEGVIEKQNEDVGFWGYAHSQYLKVHHPRFLSHLIASGEAHDYLAGVNKRASERFDELMGNYIKERRIKSIRKKEAKRTALKKAEDDVLDEIYETIIFNIERKINDR